MTKRLLLAGPFALALLAGCGRVEPLQPAAGQTMPPKPLTAAQAPETTELLERTPEARPNRDALLPDTSEERRDDRFDLPPS